MFNFKKLGLILMISSLGVFSCKKDKKDDPTPEATTVAEDKANLKASFDEMVDCAGEIKDGKLVTLIQSMFDITQGESLNEGEWLEPIFDSLPNVFDFDAIETDNNFDLSYHAGVYTYSNSSKEWTKTSSSNSSMTLKFPSVEGGSNDLELYIGDYAGANYQIDGETVKLPTSFKLTFKQNSDVLVKMELKSATYKQLADISIPTHIEIDITLAPMDISVIAREVSAGKFDLNITMDNSNSCSSSIFAELTMAHGDYESLTEDDFVTLKGHVSHGDMKVTTDIDLKTLLEIEDPTENQINSLVNIDCYMSDVKIGDINLTEDVENNDVNIMMVYKDGTTEDMVDVYLVPFVDDLELELFDLLGNWN